MMSSFSESFWFPKYLPIFPGDFVAALLHQLDLFAWKKKGGTS
jgi:hypothetical protein